MTLPVDAVSLSAGGRPNDTEELASLLKIPRNAAGFFIEAMLSCGRWTSLRRASFLRPGPQPQAHQRVIAQAQARPPGPGPSWRTPGRHQRRHRPRGAGPLRRCWCASAPVPTACPDQPENVSEINEALCQGCGTCASECPAKVIQVAHFEDDQLSAKIKTLF